VAADQIVGGGAHALVRHVRQVDARGVLEQLGRKVIDAAGSRCGVVQLARPGLGEREELGGGIRGNRRGDGEDQRAFAYHRYRHEGRQRIVGQVKLDRRLGGVGGGDHHDRVAVGRRLGHEGFADRSRGAGAVFDDHGLAQCLGEAPADGAREDVVRTSRRGGDDEQDGLRRESRYRLRKRRVSVEQQGADGGKRQRAQPRDQEMSCAYLNSRHRVQCFKNDAL
jgi:hypothetical protein